MNKIGIAFRLAARFSSMLKKIFNKFGFDIRYYVTAFFDIAPADIDVIKSVNSFSMTSTEALNAVIESIKYITAKGVPGAIVECGVWKGGSMMAAAKTLQRIKRNDIDLYLFDTFKGMTAPSDEDRDPSGRPFMELYQNSRRVGAGVDLCLATMDDTQRNMASTGYPKERIHLVKGDILETVPGQAPASIALLRLDTDWYESTKHELLHLYPRLSRGGVLIVDDYGLYPGARKAVDEYLRANGIHVLLQRVDISCRLCIKP